MDILNIPIFVCSITMSFIHIILTLIKWSDEMERRNWTFVKIVLFIYSCKWQKTHVKWFYFKKNLLFLLPDLSFVNLWPWIYEQTSLLQFYIACTIIHEKYTRGVYFLVPMNLHLHKSSQIKGVLQYNLMELNERSVPLFLSGWQCWLSAWFAVQIFMGPVLYIFISEVLSCLRVVIWLKQH